MIDIMIGVLTVMVILLTLIVSYLYRYISNVHSLSSGLLDLFVILIKRNIALEKDLDTIKKDNENEE